MGMLRELGVRIGIEGGGNRGGDRGILVLMLGGNERVMGRIIVGFLLWCMVIIRDLRGGG